MARKSGGGEGLALLGLLGVFFGLAWLVSGRGQDNSPLVPDPLEDQIDRAVDSLNKWFGHQWVTFTLNQLQAHLERTRPEVAWLVYTLLAVEQESINWPRMTKLALSQRKKQTALRMIRGY